MRAEALENLKGGLRALYRTLELPGRNPLKDAHAALDAAVMRAYGFDRDKDLLGQLLSLNLEVAARIEAVKKGTDTDFKQPKSESVPFLVTPPGVPGNYPNPQSLVTDDCIKP